ncbi:MAG: hypothetical protein LBR56_08150, partial [Sporomusaceae bacterium]|nr:hypothetical protein [Sporomusaceae bacterium]
YEGTLKEIAMKIREEEEKYAWISATPSEKQDFPLRNSEAVELLNLSRQLTSEKEKELAGFFLSPKTLPSANEFSSLVRAEHEAKEKSEAFEKIRQHKNYAALEKTREIQRLQLRYTLENILRRVNSSSFANENFAWGKEAVLDALKGNDLAWRELAHLTQTFLDKMGTDTETADKISVLGLNSLDKKTALLNAQDLVAHLRSGGKLGFWFFRPQKVKDSMYLIKHVKVEGQSFDNLEALSKLIKWLEINDWLETLSGKWLQHAPKPESTFFTVQKTEYKRRLEFLNECLEIQNDVTEAKGVIQFIPDFIEPPWADTGSLAELIEVIDAANARHNLLEKQKSVEVILDTIRIRLSDKKETNQDADNLAKAIIERDYIEYAKYLQRARELEHLEMQLNQRNSLFARLERSLPAVAALLKEDAHNSVWDERFVNFQNAWNWAKADVWLKTSADLSEDNHLREQAEQLRGHIQQITAKLAAAKAWHFCLAKLTEHESSHLKAWQLAMQRLGRGTGTRAIVYRKEARVHLEECRSAIPAWIMPLYRVVETIAMKPGIFDVVIVDEASQSGPEALLLQYIAKKIVVVGDSKQISPSFIGITKNDVDLLRERLISDLPFADVIGVENSFFDQAFIRYKGQICLREHFRCMPEIIQFSNDLCYTDTPLIPLKQYGAGRLAPTVGTKYIEGAVQTGKSPRVTNPAEAEAIVNFIAACCADEKYAGKTFGVISLLGDEQGKLISKMLLEKIGAVEIESRSLLCGDAYAFQGDERDVIILSMVAAPGEGHKIGILTIPDIQKRFNVAASRAKEQLFLFHSATLSELNPLCLRYRLLKYCLDPKIELTATNSNAFAKLEELTRASRRRDDLPPHPFENWFE